MEERSSAGDEGHSPGTGGQAAQFALLLPKRHWLHSRGPPASETSALGWPRTPRTATGSPAGPGGAKQLLSQGNSIAGPTGTVPGEGGTPQPGKPTPCLLVLTLSRSPEPVTDTQRGVRSPAFATCAHSPPPSSGVPPTPAGSPGCCWGWDTGSDTHPAPWKGLSVGAPTAGQNGACGHPSPPGAPPRLRPPLCWSLTGKPLIFWGGNE